jgi:hypothetical protein
MVAQIYPLVSTTMAALPHPRWCTTEHRNAGPALHRSADIQVGEIGGSPVTVQRIQMDPEPGHPDTRHELWLQIGGHFIEVTVGDAGQLSQEFRTVAASLELILDGAR